MTTLASETAGWDERWLHEPHLPPVIQRAASRLLNLEFVYQVLQINASAALAMGHILRCVDKVESAKTVFLKRVNLAALSGKTTRTVSNWLCALENAGLITKAQGHRDWGDFTCCQLQLTPKAIALFALDQPLRKSPIPITNPTDRKKISAAYKGTALEEQSSTMRQLGEDFSELSTGWTKDPERQRNVCSRQAKHHIPDDCQALLNAKISPFGIFSLMKLAKGKGKRLGDIVATRTEAIEKAKNPYAFTRHLVEDGFDYSHLRQTEAKQTQEDNTRAAESHRQKQMVGHSFTLSKKHLNLFKALDRDLVEQYRFTQEKWVFHRHLSGSDLLDFWSLKNAFVDLKPFENMQPRNMSTKDVQTDNLEGALKTVVEHLNGWRPREKRQSGDDTRARHQHQMTGTLMPA